MKRFFQRTDGWPMGVYNVLAGLALLTALVWVLISATSCATFRSGKTSIEAPHSKDQLYGVLHSLEKFAGMKHQGGKIRVTYKAGTVRARDGWYGWKVGEDLYGGMATSQGRVQLATYMGHVQIMRDLRRCPTAHELMHAILFSLSYPADHHHAIMKSLGFGW